MVQPQSQTTRYFGTVIELLRDRSAFMAEIHQSVKLNIKVTALLICSSIFFAIYGGIIGSFHSWQQALSSAIKLPALYLITLIICFPTLYFFNIIFGSRKTFGQYFTMVITAVAVISVLLFSFAPISLFFLISTNNYQFFVLLNVAVFSITGFIGVKFLYQGIRLLSKDDEEGDETRMKILRFWLMLYGFVGTQLAWTLRPFFGNPGTQFVLFREMEGNFYLSLMQAIGEILGIN
ncbi:MAG TPA: actin-binding WH2 domain-containing protein [Cyanobacteria bacterium UBA11149]|nr:actin-binding WH2 domain-containing protein [Cyanobacteria bacterium UBA11367]HBE57350.1 actin-binding WH2 domain-containing protein [Cyanobacteria bacterium UBA11366]HBK63598.1 actin-binding WH2 domain-containing protein [Cyanobacteria bacterium UBA11166]HBR75599.1 actin-binding WH2 domain-containing protein [Cyanobacteria bacterium UBA11159]HBS68005.1 actin-binding WH2 domain-containing protein [Cyanobacteria bacterium UBA11153]HBW87885.1 actin-binding WH2 domain-containing protein [Cyano